MKILDLVCVCVFMGRYSRELLRVVVVFFLDFLALK